MKKILKRVLKVVKISLACLIVLFTAVILLQRFSDSSFSIGGYRIFAVITGSMEPVYGVGDVLLCKSIDTNKLKVGDDITYKGKEGSFKDKFVTHRIQKIVDNKDGKKIFITKGVANDGIDPPIEADQIYGKVSKKLLVLSFFHSYSSSGTGFFLFVILPIMIIVGSEIIQSMLERKEKLAGVPQEINLQAVNQQIQNQNVNTAQQDGVTAEQLQQQLAKLQQQLIAQQNTQVQANTNAQVNNVAVQQVANQENVQQNVNNVNVAQQNTNQNQINSNQNNNVQ